eukprot:scaffold14754_cov39-Phaeocystis_antarctica.AAC.1
MGLIAPPPVPPPEWRWPRDGEKLEVEVEVPATLCDRGCNPRWSRLQPHVIEAATLCDRAVRSCRPRSTQVSDGVARWVPAVVLQLLVDGSFQARIQVPGDPFED